MSQLKLQEIANQVSVINDKLRNKGFNLVEIDIFWKNFIKNIPKIVEVGVENIKVCTGCGRLDIEPVDPKYLACCPDSNYKPIEL